MPDNLPQEAPSDAGTRKVSDAERDTGKAEAGTHLTRRQTRNADLTESSQGDPTGGAHSGTPDPTNP